MRALLIGNSFYQPGGMWASLSGCARDAERLRTFLRHRLDVPAGRIRTLTASAPRDGGPGPAEPPEDRSTYENMVGELQRLAREAEQGEQVLIYFTGHGERVPTCIPEVKGRMALDEVLLPWNAADPAARCLRDVELAEILRKLVDGRGALVTLILDCCRARAAARRDALPREIGVRGSTVTDGKLWPTESLVAPNPELADVWRSLAKGPKRNVTVGSGWQPNPHGYVLLAACRAGELAFEFPFERSSEKRGVFTHALLEALGHLTPGLTYRRLFDRIVAEVHSRFEQQTPVLEGDEDRVVFGDRHVREPAAVNVLRVERGGQRVLLETGLAQGVERRARFAIQDTAGEPAALAQVTMTGSTASWSRIVESFQPVPVEEGFRAFLQEAGAPRLCRTVRLQKAPSAQGQKALDDLAHLLARGGGRGFVRLASEREGADFLVVVDPLGRCQVTDPAGIPLPSLPQPSAQRGGAAQLLASLLVHLSKFRNVQRLVNRDGQSPLRGKLLLELGRPPEHWSKGQPADFAEAKPVRRVCCGAWTWLRIVNTSMQALSLGVLDVRPDWGVSLVEPPPHGGDGFMLDAGKERVLPFRFSLPSWLQKGTDLIKVVAAAGRVGFRWLELPHLEPPRRTVMRGAAVAAAVQEPAVLREPTNELEALFAALTAARGPKRGVRKPSAHPGREWTVAHLEIQVAR